MTSPAPVPSNAEAMEKLFEEAKKNVRSLLISTQDGLSTMDILRDYSNFVNKPLPYAELGHYSVESLLMNMPDVCYPIGGYGHFVHWVAVADSSTAHIQKLVQCQRGTKRKEHAPRFRMPDTIKGNYIRETGQGLGAAAPLRGRDNDARRRPNRSPMPFSNRRGPPPSLDLPLEQSGHQSIPRALSGRDGTLSKQSSVTARADPRWFRSDSASGGAPTPTSSSVKVANGSRPPSIASSRSSESGTSVPVTTTIVPSGARMAVVTITAPSKCVETETFSLVPTPASSSSVNVNFDKLWDEFVQDRPVAPAPLQSSSAASSSSIEPSLGRDIRATCSWVPKSNLESRIPKGSSGPSQMFRIVFEYRDLIDVQFKGLYMKFPDAFPLKEVVYVDPEDEFNGILQAVNHRISRMEGVWSSIEGPMMGENLCELNRIWITGGLGVESKTKGRFVVKQAIPTKWKDIAEPERPLEGGRPRPDYVVYLYCSLASDCRQVKSAKASKNPSDPPAQSRPASFPISGSLPQNSWFRARDPSPTSRRYFSDPRKAGVLKKVSAAVDCRQTIAGQSDSRPPPALPPPKQPLPQTPADRVVKTSSVSPSTKVPPPSSNEASLSAALRKIFAKKPKGVYLGRVAFEYKSLFKPPRDFPVAEFGCENIRQVLEKFPDEVVVEDLVSGVTMVKPAPAMDSRIKCPVTTTSTTTTPIISLTSPSNSSLTSKPQAANGSSMMNEGGLVPSTPLLGPALQLIPDDMSPERRCRAEHILSNCLRLWRQLSVSTAEKVANFAALYERDFQESLDLSMTGFHDVCDLGLFLASNAEDFELKPNDSRVNFSYGPTSRDHNGPIVDYNHNGQTGDLNNNNSLTADRNHDIRRSYDHLSNTHRPRKNGTKKSNNFSRISRAEDQSSRSESRSSCGSTQTNGPSPPSSRSSTVDKKSVSFNPTVRTEELDRAPVDTVPAGEAFELRPPPEVVPGAVVDVVVGFWENTETLWARLADADLKSIMNGIDAFYQAPRGDQYSIPESMIRPGLVCAALYKDDIWYRAVIVEDLGPQRELKGFGVVRALFVDYGNVSSVLYYNLRFLRKTFFRHPVFAFKCRVDFGRLLVTPASPDNENLFAAVDDRLLDNSSFQIHVLEVSPEAVLVNVPLLERELIAKKLAKQPKPESMDKVADPNEVGNAALRETPINEETLRPAFEFNSVETSTSEYKSYQVSGKPDAENKADEGLSEEIYVVDSSVELIPQVTDVQNFQVCSEDDDALEDGAELQNKDSNASLTVDEDDAVNNKTVNVQDSNSEDVLKVNKSVNESVENVKGAVVAEVQELIEYLFRRIELSAQELLSENNEATAAANIVKKSVKNSRRSVVVISPSLSLPLVSPSRKGSGNSAELATVMSDLVKLLDQTTPKGSPLPFSSPDSGNESRNEAQASREDGSKPSLSLDPPLSPRFVEILPLGTPPVVPPDGASSALAGLTALTPSTSFVCPRFVIESPSPPAGSTASFPSVSSEDVPILPDLLLEISRISSDFSGSEQD